MGGRPYQSNKVAFANSSGASVTKCLVSLGEKTCLKFFHCVALSKVLLYPHETHECVWKLHIEAPTLSVEDKIEDEILQLEIFSESTEIPSSDNSEK